MSVATRLDHGRTLIDADECKGCGLCVEACPPKCLALSEQLNHYGYSTASYTGSGCTACGICFLACPEPGAITVFRRRAARPADAEPGDAARREAAAC